LTLEENCFGGDLGHGTSMPDLSGKITDKTVQYSQVSKPRSMQNIYFSSKDLDSDSDEEDSRQKFKSEFWPNFGAMKFLPCVPGSKRYVMIHIIFYFSVQIHLGRN
jgi:hypothetical protein